MVFVLPELGFKKISFSLANQPTSLEIHPKCPAFQTPFSADTTTWPLPTHQGGWWGRAF